MYYKSNYTTRPWTSYKNTREQVVPEVGLVFSIGRESYYIFNVAPPNMVSPPKDTQGFPHHPDRSTRRSRCPAAQMPP